MQNSHSYDHTSSPRSSDTSWRGRARSVLASARREATTPKIAAAVAAGAAAAAIGFLRDPQRRERLRQSASKLKARLGFGEATSTRSTRQMTAIG